MINNSRVADRGIAPASFIDDLVKWGRNAPDTVFAVNAKFDIYSAVRPELGPWKGLLHRRAVMLEVLRVLGGFESSWNWNESYDRSNPREKDDLTKSAGIFQVSADSMGIDPSLKHFATAYGANKPDAFQYFMKTNHEFAIGYTARLLRFTTKHHGPVRDGFINPWLRRSAVEEFISLIA